uniref:Toll-like receptor 3 n=1 Tax=Andrias davidianus TaxID=141262 RepID=V5QP20_ANDDA|nr:toll-like receptor 3 [Andrias davidianus]
MTMLPFCVGMLFRLLTLCILRTSAENPCKIIQATANCSHLKLTKIPSDLPSNITVLDLSHNQLNGLPAANLSRYNQLVQLHAGFNVIAKLEPGLCQKLPQLQVLNLQHNELNKLSEKYFSFCGYLLELRLGNNRIKEINRDFFKNLKNLRTLDVSHNNLQSARLGSEQQLQNLQELLLSFNSINQTTKEDFHFLSNTSLEVLDLSNNPLKEFLPGCFHAIGSLNSLSVENINLGPDLTKTLCSELSGTAVQSLRLSRNQLSRIYNTTLEGLLKTNLTILDLSNNALSEIDNGSFASLPHLEYLSLEDNRIVQLTPQTFSGLSNVKFLNLRKSLGVSKHSQIHDFSFQQLKHLENLIMDDNSFPGITKNMFTGLISLKYLSLCNCAIQLKTITNTTFVSLADSSLISLNLTKSGISKLQSEAFSSLRHLQVLEVGHNNIDQELTGDELKGLDNIEVIYLSYNKHLTLTSDSFRFVPSLKRLLMRRTTLSKLDLSPSPFHSLQNLTVLDVSNNNIANINEDIFDGLQKLSILNLEHNNLARLWKSANPGGPVMFLKCLRSLQILRLGFNGLDEIPVEALKGLSQLKQLEMQSNMLNLLKPSLFDDEVSLSLLNLQKNLVTSVEKDVFGPILKNLENLYMGYNPFDCTCESISFFVNWLNTSNASVPGLSSEYICNTPSKYHGISVMLFDNAACKDSAPFRTLFIINASIVLVFMIMVIFILFQGWRIQFYWNVSVNRILGYKEVDRRREHFTYDAYIIHARKDTSWVDKNLLPLEKNDNFLKFCFEERDFDAGISEIEAIVNSVRISRKIIFVVTYRFLKDPWCKRFKVHHAVHQAIEQSLDSIILIFLDDIPDYKLNQTICLRRGMFKSNCILFWPAQKERVNAFHQQLKVAIGSSNNAN